MKSLLSSTSFYSMIARAPEGEGGGTPPADTQSILYGDDKPADDAAPKDEVEPKADDAGDKTKDDAAAGEWKEYAPDPEKSDEENAAAKAEHDKGKPAEKSEEDKLRETVPEDGKYALKMPEGVEVDTELLAALGPKFAAKKMTNGEAQELADEFIKVQEARATKQAEQWAETINGWADQAKADKEIGGAKWEGTVAASRRAVETFGDADLKEYLNASGGGNHPSLIRFMAKVGAMIKEDTPAGGNIPGRAARDRTEVLYPDDQPKGA